ncbi:MCE family protein, partial [Mycobacterium asiaticum]|uniref:MCE family protein n=1 Tax=Mycobacterium asiaticum TaxID=1790 RepID=UPI0015618004
VSALFDAARGLQATAPELLDALHQAVEPMQTFAETREQLTSLLSAADYTVGTTHQSFNNHIDQLIRISTELTPVVGVLAIKSNNFVPAVTKLDNLASKFMEEVWVPELGVGHMRARISFTQTFAYSRADCPRYGELKGPSCYNAPLVPNKPALPDVLLPQNYQPPKDLAPPPGTVVGPDGNLVVVGPPAINPYPGLTDANPPLPPFISPSPPIRTGANPDDPDPSPPAHGPVPPPPLLGPPAAGSVPTPSSFGGNVGPVGSQYERNLLSVISGRPATAATEILLGPVARGTTVSLVPSSGGSR